ncbi:hypothetical protein BH09PAT2_BH09PAT2_10360 [soil metagenome]
MAKKKTTKSVSKAHKKAAVRHFRPTYSAHPIVHLATVLVVIVLLAIILSYIIFGVQNPSLFA